MLEKSTYTGDYLIDSKIDRPALSYACSVSRFLANLHFPVRRVSMGAVL